MNEKDGVYAVFCYNDFMSNILDIKPIIRDLIAENIDSTFKTVYWVS